MNLLAHALLTPPHHDELLVGNLTADWIKGRARTQLPHTIQAGFTLHRHIDTFTDTHPLVASCSQKLEPAWSRYSPILVDIFFDHLLASHWHLYSRQPLPQFTSHVYTTLNAHTHLLPDRATFAISHLIADDWFATYPTLDGIRLTLTRMSHRLRHDIELAPAVDDLAAHYDFFKTTFDAFFPQLQHALQTSTTPAVHPEGSLT
ncbi:MAG: ACP phosphodiesterase [Phycisphaerae bacterium]